MSDIIVANGVTVSGPTTPVNGYQRGVMVLNITTSGDGTAIIEGSYNDGFWFPVPAETLYSDPTQTVVRIANCPVSRVRANVTITTGTLGVNGAVL